MDTRSPGVIDQALEWAYAQCLDTVPDLAAEYLRDAGGDKEQAIETLILNQQMKCGASGFVTGLGGIATLPLAIPVDLATTYYINIRMVASIAYLYGHSLESDNTKTLVYLALLGNGAAEVLSKVGAEVGRKVAGNALSKIPGQVLIKINKAVGFRLVTKAGERGVLNFVRIVPVLGGVVGGSINAWSCRRIGCAAKEFLKNAG